MMQLLEQVHVYTKEAEVNEYDEAAKQEGESVVKQDPDDNDDGIPFERRQCQWYSGAEGKIQTD